MAMKTNMKPELIEITPQIAEQWLKYNTGNRKLPIGNYKYYCRLLESGEFILTHQAMAFVGDSENPKRLLDGQTRLSAIVRTGITVFQWVFWNCDEKTFAVLDGGKPRSFMDHHGWSKHNIAMVNVIHWLANYMRCGKITKSEADRIIEVWGPLMDLLMESCPTNKKGISCAPVRIGFIIAMKRNPKYRDEIAGFYRNLVLGDLKEVPRGVCSLYAKLLEVKGAGRDAISYQVPLVVKMLTPYNWDLAKTHMPNEKAKIEIMDYISSSLK